MSAAGNPRATSSANVGPDTMPTAAGHIGAITWCARPTPAGSVGVDPVCLLGLNVGGGAEIQLRVHTDDLRGVRKFGIVMDTVWYELAHNSISAHTPEFFALVSTLNTWPLVRAGGVFSVQAPTSDRAPSASISA